MQGKGSKNRTADFKKYWDSEYWNKPKKKDPRPNPEWERDLFKVNDPIKKDSK